MNLKSVIFTTAYLSYVRGDIAGFAVQVADDLIHGKKVAKHYVAGETDATSTEDTIPVSEAHAFADQLVAEARAEVETKVKAVEERAGDLDQREADLKAREAALADAEAEMVKRRAEAMAEAQAATGGAKDDDKKTTTTKPPKQGTK